MFFFLREIEKITISSNKNIFFLNIKNGNQVDFILKDTATNEAEVTKLLATLASDKVSSLDKININIL